MLMKQQLQQFIQKLKNRIKKINPPNHNPKDIFLQSD